MALAALGTCTYNGVAFNSFIKSKLTYKPVYDKAGRAIPYTEHTWNVEGVVSAGTYGSTTSTDDDVNLIKKNLLQPGGALTIQGHGVGDTYLNQGSLKDVAWGPKPQLLEIQPFSNKSCYVRYALVWRVPTQCDLPTTKFSIMEFNFDWSVSIGKNGITTRTITGYITIPQTRNGVNTKTLLDNVDRYRDKIVPPTLTGFERTQNYKVSYDKNQLDFTITDTELATQNPYPPGITDADVTADLSCTGKVGRSGQPTGMLMDWDWTVSGRLTVASNMPTAWAWEKFLMILASRYKWLSANKGNLLGLPGGPIQANLVLKPLHFNASESLFSLTSSFSVSYRIQAYTEFRTILRASGLWQPIEGTSHAMWNESMLPMAHAARGRANLGLANNSDVIVDLCGTNYPVLNVGIPSLAYKSASIQGAPCPDITTQNSYMDWDNGLSQTSVSGRIYHMPLSPGQAMVEQIKHDQQHKIIMSGHAQRILYKVDYPRLLKVNGQSVYPVGPQYSGQHSIGSWCGYPIYFAAWKFTYQLKKAYYKEIANVPPKIPAIGAPAPFVGVEVDDLDYDIGALVEESLGGNLNPGQ